MNYLAIDGGGTKTDFMLADGDGNILSRVILEATNPNDVGFDKPSPRLPMAYARYAEIHLLTKSLYLQDLQDAPPMKICLK